MPEVSFTGPDGSSPLTNLMGPPPAAPMAEPELPPMPEAVEEEAEVTPDTELFPGGPTKAQIDAWKEQHGDVFVTEVADGKYVLWRTLRRAEYRNLVAEMEDHVARGASNAEATMNNEEAMTQLCMLWPQNVSAQALAADLAGVPSIVSQQIMEASGFLSLQVRQL